MTYLSTPSCDGTSSSVVTSASCTFASSVVNGAPFLVDWGNSVWAKVSATNAYGTTDFSTPGNGATIITGPDPPTSLLST